MEILLVALRFESCLATIRAWQGLSRMTLGTETNNIRTQDWAQAGSQVTVSIFKIAIPGIFNQERHIISGVL